MSAKPTPGPWRVIHFRGSIADDFAVYTDGLENDHLVVGEFTGHPRTRLANARLVAAAPDLLEAAEQALDGLRAGGMAGEIMTLEAMDALADAVKKARGQP